MAETTGIAWKSPGFPLARVAQLELISLRDLPGAERLEWVITGGESKQGRNHVPRPYDVEWARRIIWACADLGIPCFVKQLGDQPVDFAGGDFHPVTRASGSPLSNAGGVMEEWPLELRVRQMPRVYDARP